MPQESTSLDRFVDIIPADPVTFWPPAVGWWFVIALAALWCLVFLLMRIKRWFKNRYRREALQILEKIESSSSSAPLSTLVQIDSLLKRVALAAYPREQVASLSGIEWMNFLESTGNDHAFQNEPVVRLASAASDVDSAELSEQQLETILKTCKKWIRSHSEEAQPC